MKKEYVDFLVLTRCCIIAIKLRADTQVCPSLLTGSFFTNKMFIQKEVKYLL